MTIERRTFHYADLDLGTGRSLRVGVTRDAEGEPDRLIAVPVWSEKGADHRHRLDVPASILPDLRRALDELDTPDEEAR